jgi:hypothetical protein
MAAVSPLHPAALSLILTTSQASLRSGFPRFINTTAIACSPFFVDTLIFVTISPAQYFQPAHSTSQTTPSPSFMPTQEMPLGGHVQSPAQAYMTTRRVAISFCGTISLSWSSPPAQLHSFHLPLYSMGIPPSSLEKLDTPLPNIVPVDSFDGWIMDFSPSSRVRLQILVWREGWIHWLGFVGGRHCVCSQSFLTFMRTV